MSETAKNASDVLSLGGKAVGATASTGAGSTPATFAGVHVFVRGQEYAHKGGFWCWGDFTNEDEPNSSATPDRWYSCDGMTHDLLDALAAARAEVEAMRDALMDAQTYLPVYAPDACHECQHPSCMRRRAELGELHAKISRTLVVRAVRERKVGA